MGQDISTVTSQEKINESRNWQNINIPVQGRAPSVTFKQHLIRRIKKSTDSGKGTHVYSFALCFLFIRPQRKTPLHLP